jgi:type IV secretion system protein VirB10
MGGLIVAIPLLVFAVRSNKHRAAENTDPFASSRNKAAVESADIVIQAARDAAKREKVRFVREVEEGAPGKEARFTQQESKSTPEEALLSPDADIRAQRHSAALASDNLDARSLTATSVVAIPNRNATRARTESSHAGELLPDGSLFPDGKRPTTQETLSMLSSRDSDPNMQQQKRGFLVGGQNASFTLSHTVDSARERELKTGSLIPATLLTGINSDLPGAITAQVSSHVYDTASGNTVVVPQGSRLFGQYDSQVTYGQSRVLAAWNRIVFPDGRSLNLDVMGGSDAAGQGGFADEVHRHYGRIFGSALLMSVMSAGIQLSQPQARAFDNISAQQTIAANIGVQMGQTGMEVTRRNLNVQPTIVIRPGYRFQVIVNKDFVVSEEEAS